MATATSITNLSSALEFCWRLIQFKKGVSAWKQQVTNFVSGSSSAEQEGSASIGTTIEAAASGAPVSAIQPFLPFDQETIKDVLDEVAKISSDSVPIFEATTSKPASLTSSGSVGNYFLDGTQALYLCIAVNTWSKVPNAS